MPAAGDIGAVVDRILLCAGYRNKTKVAAAVFAYAMIAFARSTCFATGAGNALFQVALESSYR